MYYGSPKVPLDRDYVVILDLEGLETYLEKYGSRHIRVVYIYCEEKERARRAELRGTFSNEEWQRRLADDNMKFSKENLIALANAYDANVIVMNNSGEKPTFCSLDELKEEE